MKRIDWGRIVAWLRRHWRLVGSVCLAAIVIVIVQFMYPSGRPLPFARLDGERVGAKSQKQTVQLIIDRYTTAPLTLQTTGPAKKVTDKTTAAMAGVVPDTGKIVDGLQAYPWWQRIVPFSLLVKGLSKNQAVVTKIDDERFNEYAKSWLSDCHVDAKNAAVAVRDGAVVLDSAKNGQVCDKEALRKALLGAKLQQKAVTLELTAKVVKPARSDKDVQSMLHEAQSLTDRKIILKLAGTDYPVDKATIAAWLVITEDSKDKKKLTVDVDIQKIRDYLAEMQKKIYIAPGITTVATMDGNETSRTEGAAGRGINHTATADALKKQVLDGDGTVTGELVSIPSRVVYQRSYSPTRAGLQALLNDIVADKGDYGIAVRMLDGTVTSANGSKRYHPASTYKMYVAYSLLKRIASGEIHWEDAATGGKNISQCFDVMIINSDNTCAEWLGEKIGWANINNEVHAIGLSNTSTIRGGMYSTAEDESLFLVKLQNGSILGATERDRLLDVMKRQIYRSGIPAGVGVSVADKVGFLDGKLHDAAIVYASHGTYALTILSYGSSWAQIADAARQINAQLNRM